MIKNYHFMKNNEIKLSFLTKCCNICIMIKVMMLIDISREPERRILRGLVQYANERGGWVFNQVSHFLRESTDHCSEIVELAKKFEADAIYGTWPGIIPEEALELGIPIILRDWKEQYPGFPSLSGKNREIGNMAAEFFLKKNYESFAYLGFKDIIWAEKRLEGYKEGVIRHGKFASLMVDAIDTEWNTVVNWLKELPKPVALMACNDVCAHAVTEICLHSGITIPDELALLGVDNDEFLCNISHPTLSSIILNFEKLGYELGGRIEEMVESKTIKQYVIFHEPAGIMERGSTQKYIIKDAYIRKIVDRIEERHAENICIEDIIQDIPLSRRSIEMRFRAEMDGVSMLKHLTTTRIKHFSRLLVTTDLPVAEAAEKSGFSDVINVFRTFRKYTGCTPLNYRKKYMSVQDSSQSILPQEDTR